MRQQKTYRVVSDYCGQTALAGYRHTLRGAKLLLEWQLKNTNGGVTVRIEELQGHPLERAWIMVAQTIMPKGV